MLGKHLFGHCGVGFYLLITAAAYLYTMTGITLSFLPWPLVYYSYGMMAPYQTYVTYEQGLLVEGQERGSAGQEAIWRIIDHQRYFPYLRGERVVREWLMPYRQAKDPVLLQQKYYELAAEIQAAERRQGRAYRALRLSWERWPVSPTGHETWHHDPFVSREFLVQWP